MNSWTRAERGWPALLLTGTCVRFEYNIVPTSTACARAGRLLQRNSVKVSAAEAELILVLPNNLLIKLRVYISNVGFSECLFQRKRPKH